MYTWTEKHEEEPRRKYSLHMDREKPMTVPREKNVHMDREKPMTVPREKMYTWTEKSE